MARDILDTCGLDLFEQRHDDVFGQKPAVEGEAEGNTSVAEGRGSSKLFESQHDVSAEHVGSHLERGPGLDDAGRAIAEDGADTRRDGRC